MPQKSSTTTPAATVTALSGLYAITPQYGHTESLCQAVAQAVAGGAQLVQYRNKSHDNALRQQQAQALLHLCRQYRVPFIINDDIELCLAVAADGVHLGRDDQTLAHARQRLGPQRLIGISCYADLHRARLAAAAGADYVAFGSFFPSTTKPGAPPCPLEILRDARELPCPVVAIGGITAENGASLVRAGADLLAVISDLFDARDITQRAAQYSNLFSQITNNQP